MCGIAGIIDKSLNRETLLRVSLAMEKKMRHRGPDAIGYYVKEPISMSMVRLSIIDLVYGNQPFYSPITNSCIFQNGEIYNYRELKKELVDKGAKFSTSSDTEVLAVGYDFWGLDKLLQKIDGMYSISILDEKKNKLFLIRDRFGEKPLFYTTRNGKFAYSSYLKSFKEIDWVDFSISENSLLQYLCLHFVCGEDTIFSSIKRVLPGCYLEIDLESCSMKSKEYYSIPITLPKLKDNYEILDVLEESIRSRLVSDVPLGIFLSGGIDSSLITAIASKYKSNISTFSMSFEAKEYDESKYANLVAKEFGTTHYNLNFDENSFLDLLPKVIKYLDEPIGDQALLPVFWLAEKSGDIVKVVLSGEGGDEVFGGYSYYSKFLANSGVKHLLNRLLPQNTAMTPSGFPFVTSIQQALSLLNKSKLEDSSSWEDSWLHKINQANNDLQRATLADFTTWLPDDLLVKFDRMTMANSLEGRAPFLAPKLVEMGLNLHQSLRIFNKEKVALKNIAEKILPKDIIIRKKQGFVLPMESWIKSFFSITTIHDFIQDCNFPLLNQMKLEFVISTNLHNPRFVFSLLILLLWYKNF